MNGTIVQSARAVTSWRSTVICLPSTSFALSTGIQTGSDGPHPTSTESYAPRRQIRYWQVPYLSLYRAICEGQDCIRFRRDAVTTTSGKTVSFEDCRLLGKLRFEFSAWPIFHAEEIAAVFEM